MHALNRILIICGCTALPACGGKGHNVPDETGRSVYPVMSLKEILSGQTENPYSSHLDSAPEQGCERIPLRPIGHLRRLFNDNNALHLDAANELGVRPLQSLSEAWSNNRELVPVNSCRDFYVDELHHSYPYLVPEAAALLHDIGAAFNDSLAARGGGAYRIKVTSLLRTPATVQRLRRVNRNASGESAHSFGTTFDISYSRFICDSITTPRTFEDLKNLLGEVLLDLKNRGRCYVKMERRQACFHITARPS